jgi:hypothetical protein
MNPNTRRRHEVESTALAFEEWRKDPDSHLFGMRLGDKEKITVLDRMTGWGGGTRDVETGYTDKDGKFWLASGGFDIRHSEAKTIGEAIALIKENANTCVPTENED